MKIVYTYVPATLLLVMMAGHWTIAENGGTNLPETFLRCRRKDADLNSCLHTAIQSAIPQLKDGIPSLELLPLDPLVVKNINIQDGVGRPVKMSLDLNNAQLYGLSDGRLKEVRADLDNKYLELKANVPETRIVADYVMDGKFLVLPMKGKGKCNMNLTDYDVTIKIRAELLSKEDNIYWDVKEFDLHVDTMKLFQVNFDNLFNGDKNLGDNTNRVLNENWKEFFEELRPTLHDTFGAVFRELANVIFSKVPENKIFLES